MDCRNEEALVRRTLEGMTGVERLEFDLPQRKLTVSHRLVTVENLDDLYAAVYQGMKG